MAIHELKMVTSLVSKENRAMKWISSLQDEQKEFIQNLGNISSYKELVYLFEKELLNKVEETSRQVAKIKRYKLGNYFLGLLGETAVKKYINDYYMTDQGYDKNNYLTPINFDIYENGGDPGYDFLSLIFDNFGVQVKTTKLENAQGNFNNLKWYITPKEIGKNKVLVCVAALEKPNKNCNRLLISGFIPVDMILELYEAGDIEVDTKWKKYILKIEHLLYCEGLLAYLNNPNITIHENNCNNPESYRVTGAFYFRCGFYEKALIEYNKALSLNSNMYTVYSDRAGCYYMLENCKSDERLRQRTLGKPYEEDIHQKADKHLSQKKLVPLVPEQFYDDILNELFYANLTLDDDLDIFITNQIEQIKNELNKIYPENNDRKQPSRITERFSISISKIFGQSLKDADQSIAICPEYIPTYINRGLLYYQGGLIQARSPVMLEFFKKAINSYSLALDLAIDVSRELAAKTYLCRSEAYIDSYRFIDLEFEEEKQFYANAAHDDAIKATKLFEELEWFGAANTARAKIHLILSLLREQ